MSTGKKIALGILIFLALLAITLIIVIPRLVDLDRYRPEVVTRLAQETQRPVQVRRLTLAFSPALSVRVDDFGLGNPVGFPEGNAVQIRRIYVVLDARALWNRQIVIKSLELEDPVVSMLSDRQGCWNLENPPAAPRARFLNTALASNPPAFSLGSISKVKLTGGRVTAADLTPAGQPAPVSFDASGITSDLEQVDLSALTTSGSPTQPALSTARPVASHGNLKIASVRVGEIEASDVKSDVRLFPRQVLLDDLSFSLFGGRSQGNASVDFASRVARYRAALQFSGLDMARLLAAFPGARGQMTGKMEGQLNLTGEAVHSSDPLAGKQGTGAITIHDGQLPTLQLNKNLMQLLGYVVNSASGKDPSAFSLLSADLNIGAGRITSKNITLHGNGIDIQASGSLSLDGPGQLNYQGVTKIAAKENAFSNLLAGMLGSKLAGGHLTFGFTLGGTPQAPRFGLKTKQNSVFGGQGP